MSENILLVEDEEAMRMVLTDRLEGQGYVVDSAPDGETGFQKATSRPFDLMIFDIILPHRNGLELCRDVRSVGLGTPILLLSAYHQTVVKTAGFELGADDYVTKPFNMHELNARVQALLRRTGGRSSNVRSPQPYQPTSTQEHETLQATVVQVPNHRPIASEDSRLQDEFESSEKDFSRLAEVVPQLRKMLDEEKQSEQTSRNTRWLRVAEGIIEFLEEVFQGERSLKRDRSREM